MGNVNISKTVGNNLRIARINAGYTQKEVADKLGISQSYISRLEKRIIDKMRQEIENLVKIA